MAAPNPGKYKNFAPPDTLPETVLDVQLQKHPADERDAILKDIHGSGVSEVFSGWSVKTVPGLGVEVSDGSGIIAGQYCKAGGIFLLNLPDNILQPSVIHVYVQATSVYSATQSSRIAMLAFTTSAAPADSIVLADVNTQNGQVLTIEDKRPLTGSQEEWSHVDGTTVPASLARGFSRRVSMFASRFQSVIGTFTGETKPWHSFVGGTDVGGPNLPSAQRGLQGLKNKFLSTVSGATNSHKHTGVNNDVAGPKVESKYITVAAAGDISSINLQNAIDELGTKKLSLSGGTLTGPVGLPSPTADNQWANRAFVESFPLPPSTVLSKALVSNQNVGGGPDVTIFEGTMVTKGGMPVFLPEGGVNLYGTILYEWTDPPSWRNIVLVVLRYFRNGVIFRILVHAWHTIRDTYNAAAYYPFDGYIDGTTPPQRSETEDDHNPGTEPSRGSRYSVWVPLSYVCDSEVKGVPGTYTYQVKVAVNAITGSRQLDTVPGALKLLEMR